MAMPLHDVDSTLNRLAMLELLVGLVVLAVVAALAFWLVRRELRPLRADRGHGRAPSPAGDLIQRVRGGRPGAPRSAASAAR